MLAVKTNESYFSLEKTYSRNYKTTMNGDFNEPDSQCRYRYLINYENHNEQVKYQIVFSSKSSDLVQNWLNYHSKSNGIENHPEAVEVEKNFEESILMNCLDLKDKVQSPSFFGTNVLHYSEDRNKYTPDIQIDEFQEYKQQKLVYLKKGAPSYYDNSVKISDYKQFIEWDPTKSIIKMIKLTIKQGQRYSGSTKIVFELNYYNDTIQFFSSINKKEAPKWSEIIYSVITDEKIAEKSVEMIKLKIRNS